MSKIRQALSFATLPYRRRARIAFAGYVRRRPMALLQLRPGRDNPYRIYDRMRLSGTLAPTRMEGNWFTTSHRVCDVVLRDRRFGVQPADGSPPSSSDARFDLSFLEMNPPDHTRLRRLVQPAFSPRHMAGYRPRIEATMTELLDKAEAAGDFDLVSAFALPLSIAVIADLLGIPEPDTKSFARHGAVIATGLDGIRSLPHASRLQAANAELARLFDDLFALRRREPVDDVVSRVVAAEGDQVRSAEMLSLCVLLLVAGFDTTVNMIGNAVNALLDHPQQWNDLCDDPAAMVERAVEEALRFDPPVQWTWRYALEPLTIEGKEIGKDQFVVTLIGAANRDPQVYPDPNRFDIHREQTANHLAFSSGIHYCLGQPLAQLEATIALRSLAERMPGLRRAGATRRRNSNAIRGMLRLPVRASTPVDRAPAPPPRS